MYNMKDFNEKAVELKTSCWDEIYDFEGHRIAICQDSHSRRYYNICVDGKTIATRAHRDNGVKLALKYLNSL